MRASKYCDPISVYEAHLDGFGYEAGDLAGGAELDDLLHVARVLLGVGAEGASVGVRVHGVVHAALQHRRSSKKKSENGFHFSKDSDI